LSRRRIRRGSRLRGRRFVGVGGDEGGFEAGDAGFNLEAVVFKRFGGQFDGCEFLVAVSGLPWMKSLIRTSCCRMASTLA
jgi:hypothetical protein